jgi:hypothetical protein
MMFTVPGASFRNRKQRPSEWAGRESKLGRFSRRREELVVNTHDAANPVNRVFTCMPFVPIWLT